jgi:membrane protein required for colicin V production
MTLSWVDITITSVVVLSMITGLFRGFVKECIALCVWVFAFWVAFHYGSALDPWVAPHVQDKSVRTVIEFLIILFSSLILGGVVNAIIGFLMRRSGLSGTDRVFGMGFGFARGVFIVAILMLGVRMTGMPVAEYSKDSILYAKMDPLVDWLSGYVPDFIKKVQLFDKTGGKTIDIVHDA